MAKQNLYELLEISPEATQDEIKAAMIRLGKKYATQSQKNEAVRAHFNQIKEAYKILSSPFRRASYDDFLRQSLEDEKNSKEYRRRLKEKAVNGWQISKEHTIKGGQITKKTVLSVWRFNKRLAQKGWQVGKRLTQKGWQVGKPMAQKGWEVSKQQTQKGWQSGKQHAIKGWQMGQQPIFEKGQTDKTLKEQEADELKPIKGWKIVKQRPTSRYLRKTLVSGEKILHQAQTHWFYYLDFGALLLVIFSIYLLVFNPPFIGESTPTVSLWVPKIISKQRLEFSVWYLGLIALLFVGLMMLWEAFITGRTTQLAVTSKRILFKCGFLNRTIIEVKLRRFESITIHQNLLGIIFGYGTITITGMGGVKISVPNILLPFRLRKIIWLVLEQYVEDENFDE
jgi:curved DNA-binding protein CbpA